MDKSNTNWCIGDWYFEPESGVLTAMQGGQIQRLDPKTGALLICLLERAGKLVTKDELVQTVWPDTYASDETIARSISRLRAGLIDESRQPKYIETIPKRGYRLIASVKALQQSNETAKKTSGPIKKWPQTIIIVSIGMLLLWWFVGNPQQLNVVSEQRNLLQQADSYYHQMRLADNERAISLYQQQLELQPSSAGAYAGLANATVQRLLRWSGTKTSGDVSIVAAVESGRFDKPEARQQLQRALSLAEKAVAMQPKSASSQKALGFVLSAHGEFERAVKVYQKALEIDSNTWPVWLNLAELYSVLDQEDKSLHALKNAYKAMRASYDEQSVSIHPWLAGVAANIGEHYLMKHEYSTAEIWFRRVLQEAPLHESATLGLSQVLAKTGDYTGAHKLCSELNQRLQLKFDCAQFVSPNSSYKTKL